MQIDLVVKHGDHDQSSHGNRQASSKDVKTGLTEGKTSSMEQHLKGKSLGGRKVAAVRNTGRPNKRLVIFEDGTGMHFSAPVLAKMAFAKIKENSPATKFKNLDEVHAAGFVSFAQAHHLMTNMPEVATQIMESVKKGYRVWNEKTGKFDINNPEDTVLPKKKD